ncbi:PREDICTED: uncharacterized protein At5g39865-like [Tarenaya hassleriana]|uniref:uncharacterized protein At5g39865-like n=1 Tax=Tarenaya hassleriana TaxID=28532 RepID=UPI00053C9693|nr:PREDICTED: uncharacterized protein At5g39865-like [Tarenaya hassleriana]
MAGLTDNNMVFLEKTKSSTASSTFFNQSFTIHARPAESNSKSRYYLNPSLNRTTRVTKFYSPMESMGNSLKGKVKSLCRLFEGSRSSKSNSTESQSTLAKTKSGKIQVPDSRMPPSSNLNCSSIQLPGTEDRIVVYFTSLRGIRRTYEDCYAVRMIFRGFRVLVDERDVSMDSACRKELQSVMGEKNVTLPQVFIRGKHVGGADVIKGLFETGDLAKILEGLPVRQPGFVCQSCGDVRFMPCLNCSGGKKVFDEDEGTIKRCPECNENGLIRCPDCYN